MEWIYNPTPEQAADDAAKAEAERIEAQRPLTWTEFKDREKTLPLYERERDLQRLQIETVPADSRDLFRLMAEDQRRGRLFH